jgi:hypothetical protein
LGCYKKFIFIKEANDKFAFEEFKKEADEDIFFVSIKLL